MTLRLADLRRFVVAEQGFLQHERGTPREVERAVKRLSCVQLDSINVVERSHLLVFASRIGRVEPAAVSRLLERGRLFEYWAHEACLLHVDDWPLFRRRMRERRTHHWWGPVIQNDPAMARRILARVRREGPLRASSFEGRSGGMWELKPEKRMLDALWTAGKLVVVGRGSGFQRLYDLPEHALPADALLAPTPSAAATVKALAERAVVARGALTERGVVEHFRLAPERAQVKRALAALVREKRLARHDVEDGGAPVFTRADADVAGAPEPEGAVLLSPFENLLWDRPFARRVLGFDHLIEVYKRAPERRFGYYVLPLLVGERIVGRFDVKADREEGKLLVRKTSWEKGERARDHRERARGAVARLARCVLG